MKLLTLNTHSLIEPDYEAKREIFVNFIAAEQPEVFALQEVNQTAAAPLLGDAAATCIVPMQDWLGLDNFARINKPSTVGQNWRWRLKKTQLTKKLQKEICQLTTRYGRMNWA